MRSEFFTYFVMGRDHPPERLLEALGLKGFESKREGDWLRVAPQIRLRWRQKLDIYGHAHFEVFLRSSDNEVDERFFELQRVLRELSESWMHALDVTALAEHARPELSPRYATEEFLARIADVSHLPLMPAPSARILAELGLAERARLPSTLDEMPALAELVTTRLSANVHRIWISMLKAGREIYFHDHRVDGSKLAEERFVGKLFLHVPLVTDPRVRMIVLQGGEEKARHYEAGGVHLLNCQHPHGVKNDSAVDRVHALVTCAAACTKMQRKILEALDV